MTGNPHAQALHASKPIGVFLVTGGGVTLLADMLTEPGASATVLEAGVPYAEAALALQLGGKPDNACSPETARALAMAAFQRARLLAADRDIETLFGFSCTAALATNRRKRGSHRAHLALQTLTTTATATIEFDKGADGMGNRLIEESQITALAWQLLEQALNLDLQPPLPLPSSRVELSQTDAQPEWSQLLAGQISATPTPLSEQRPKALICGSFNPLHNGHLQMAQQARQILQTEVAFEICIDNVDKPALGFFDIAQRVAQFGPDNSQLKTATTLWLTRLPTFIAKAREFPGCTFVVGIDTLIRIGMSRYYASERAMLEAFDELKSLQSGFLVFGRIAASTFQTLASSKIPKALRDLCTEVPEEQFRVDISSSALRAASKTDA